jgi:hypothetical protein
MDLSVLLIGNLGGDGAMSHRFLVVVALLLVATIASAEQPKDLKKATATGTPADAPKPTGAASPSASAPQAPNASPAAPAPTPPPPANAPHLCVPNKDTRTLTAAELGKLCERKAFTKIWAASSCGSDAKDIANSLDLVCKAATDATTSPRLRAAAANAQPANEAALSAALKLDETKRTQLTVALESGQAPRTPNLAKPSFATPATASTPAGLFAQGLGDFLAQRAEQEVSAYATVELFSRACTSELKQVLVKTCNLLDAQGGGSEPVGLGVLRRAITYDLENSPQSFLKAVVNRVKDPIQRNGLCMVDVGIALNAGLLKERELAPLLELQTATDLKLKLYSVLTPLNGATLTDACDTTWKDLTDAVTGAETSTDPSGIAGQILAIDDDLSALHTETATVKVHDLHADVATRIAALIEAVVTASGRAPNTAALDELAAIATAIWDKDWVGVVWATASSDTLGPILLCGEMSKEDQEAKKGCRRDEKVRLVLSVVADIAQATTSDGVQAALNRVAAPIGTWRRKFDGFTFNLNGYVGAKVAYEIVPGAPTEGLALAPVLAVGLDFSNPIGPNQHWGLFLQAIDVGNVASVRLASKDSSSLTKVEATPDIEVAQLFAPGAYLTLAPLRAPFVIGLGGDFVPALRKTSNGRLHPAWHAGLFVAVDVPILEIAHH